MDPQNTPIPTELLELRLCRDVYHCPPDQLPPLSKIMKHLIAMAAENKHQKLMRGL